jgi:hypothetical protein
MRGGASLLGEDDVQYRGKRTSRAAVFGDADPFADGSRSGSGEDEGNGQEQSEEEEGEADERGQVGGRRGDGGVPLPERPAATGRSLGHMLEARQQVLTDEEWEEEVDAQEEGVSDNDLGHGDDGVGGEGGDTRGAGAKQRSTPPVGAMRSAVKRM